MLTSDLTCKFNNLSDKTINLVLKGTLETIDESHHIINKFLLKLTNFNLCLQICLYYQN